MLKITIIDTDTNETLVDTETSCIIGAVKSKDGSRSIGFTRTNALEIAETMKGVDVTKKQLLENKTIRIAYFVWSLMEEKEKYNAE